MTTLFSSKDEYIWISASKKSTVISALIKEGLFEKVRYNLVILKDGRFRDAPFTNLQNKLFFSLLTMIGLPTQHNKIVGFQTPATPIMEGIVDLHHDIMTFLTFIIVFVFYLLAAVVIQFGQDNKQDKRAYPADNVTHNSTIEVIWTTIPTLVLLFIALPSFVLLYSMDEQFDPIMTLKVIGRQWYWSYEYSDTAVLPVGEYKTNIIFDSYLDQDMEETSLFRMLKVDNDIVLPIQSYLRILVSSTDVIHSWAVPSLGVKVDATPGRLNQISVYIERAGQFFGQCSELCGLNHAFMPISVIGVPLEIYLNWVDSMKG